MKTKISKILGVAVTLAMLVSMMVVSAPASAGTLSWSAETDPSSTTLVNLVTGGLGILDVAASGDIVYVAANTTAKALYKSTDGGANFKDLSTTTDFPAGVTVKAVAIAKDNPELVAFISGANNVYYSTNGGAKWTNLGLPSDTAPAATASNLNAVDIYAGTVPYIAVGGNNTASKAEMFTYKIEILETWQARYTAAAGTAGMNGTHTDMKAVKFSPSFGTDKAILTITNDAGNNAAFQVFRYEAGDTDWNGLIGYLNAAEWGDGIILTPNPVITTGLAVADLAPDPAFLASDDDERLVYIALGATTGGGVVRLNDTVQVDLQTWNGGYPGAINSVALSEAGTLVTGAYNDNKVYQFLTPTATAPKATKHNALKQPGGSNKVTVVYSGTDVLAGTYEDEGCISLSTDDGYSFNDVALINTTLGSIEDYDINADGSIIYMTTLSGNDASVWLKKDGIWKRVLSVKDGTAASYLVRVAPDNAAAVYIAQLGTQDMWVSKDSGMESWKNVPIYALGTGDTILDFAVASADVVYAVDNDGISKTSTAGASWDTQVKPAEGVSPYMITVAPNGDVLVGDTAGFVAFSKDKGLTYSLTKDFGTGNAIVTYDDGYATNNIIYVGIGTSVKRSKATTTDTPVTRGAISAVLIVRGIAQVNGVVYVMGANATQSSIMYQALKLETAADSAAPYTDADWSDTGNIAGVSPANLIPVYTDGRNALKVSKSGTSAKLWAIDTAGTGEDLESFTDAVSLAAPAITAPADKAVIPVNPKNGDAYDITFTFKRYASTEITTATIEIATDSAFLAVIKTDNIAGITTDTIASIIGPNTAGAGGGTQVVNYMPGTTYYWRVRTTSPINSPWTATRSFTLDSLAEPFAPSGPVVGAVDVLTMPTFTWAPYPKAIKYVIEVSEFPDFKIIDWSANVDNTFYVAGEDEEFKYSTTYYWRVKGVLSESPYTAGPWVTSVFTTMADPATIEEPGTGGGEQVIITVPGETKYEVIEIPVETSAPIPTYILWVIVGVGALLIIALIVLIVRTRRVA